MQVSIAFCGAGEPRGDDEAHSEEIEMALEYAALRTTDRRVVTYSSNNRGTQWQQGVPVTGNRNLLQKLRSLLLCFQHARRKLPTRMLELKRRFQLHRNSHGFPFQWACKSINRARPRWGSRRWSHHTSPHKDHIRAGAGGASSTDGATDSSKHMFWEHPPPHGAWIALVHDKVALPQDDSTVWFVRHMSGDREAGDVTVVLEEAVAGKENETERRLWEPGMVWVPTIIRKQSSKQSKQVVRQVVGICADAESDFVEAQSAEWLIVGHGCKKAKRHFVYFRCRKRTCDCADVAGSVVWAVSYEEGAPAAMPQAVWDALCRAVASKKDEDKKRQQKARNATRDPSKQTRDPSKEQEARQRADTKRKDDPKRNAKRTDVWNAASHGARKKSTSDAAAARAEALNARQTVRRHDSQGGGNRHPLHRDRG